MKKSSQVPASLIVALAASLAASGCGSNNQCVDSRGVVLPDSYCGGGRYYSGAHWIHTGGFGGFSSGGSFGS